MDMKKAWFKVTLQHLRQISDQTLTLLHCFRVLEMGLPREPLVEEPSGS